MTLSRTGENASASSTATQRSGAASSVSAAPAPSVRRVASSGGSGAPALGGRELSRRARTIRPTSTVAVSSASQAWCSASTRVARPSRSDWASARVSSSLARGVGGGHDRAQVAEVDHVEVALGGLGAVAPLGDAHLRHELLGQLEQRAGRDRRCRRPRCARRSASRWPGARRGARRARPARRSGAAPRGATRAARCDGPCRRGGAWPSGARPRAWAAARDGCGAEAGRGAPAVALASARSLRSPRSRRPSRASAAARRRRGAAGRRDADRRGGGRGRPGRGVTWRSRAARPPAGASSSIRSGSARGPLAGTTPVISMPSTKNSASTRSTSPTLAAPGSSAAGDRAARLLGPGRPPRPRPSSRELVSSMSILRGMRARLRWWARSWAGLGADLGCTG